MRHQEKTKILRRSHDSADPVVNSVCRDSAWGLRQFGLRSGPARRPCRKAAHEGGVTCHAETNSPDMRIVQVVRKCRTRRAGVSMTVRSAGGFNSDRLNSTWFGPGGRQKVQNEANGNRPQTSCPETLNVGLIRTSLCKTNPIPGGRGRDIEGLDVGSHPCFPGAGPWVAPSACRSRNVQTTVGTGQAVVKKAQNEANWNRPQAFCLQRINLQSIRNSLCKTNPILGVEDGTSNGWTLGSNHVSRVPDCGWPLPVRLWVALSGQTRCLADSLRRYQTSCLAGSFLSY